MEDIKVEKISDVEKKICINIDPDTVNQKFDDFFNSIKKDAQIPGFRKGKAPVNMLKKYFHDRAKSTISQMLISEYYQRIVKEYNLNPVGTPRAESTNESGYLGTFNADNSYNVELSIEVFPEITPIGYKDIRIETKEVDVNKLYEEKMFQIREQFAEREQISDGVAQFGDSVVIDFKGFIDGQAFNGGEQQGFGIETLGKKNMIANFEEQLVGMHPGEERTIKAIFPDPYPQAEFLAGKEADFEVKMHNIVRKKLAEVDEDLALMVGFDDVASMQKAVKEDVERIAKAQILQHAEQEIADQLLAQNPIELPQTLLHQEKIKAMRQYKGLDKNPEALQQVMQQVENNMKKSLLFEAIFSAEEDLELAPEELNEYLEEQAKINNMSKDDVVSNLYNSNQMEAFVSILRSRKVIEFILNQGKEEQ